MIKTNNKMRLSGIELLKIAGIFLIMLHHLTGSLLEYTGWEFTVAGMNGGQFVMLVLKHCGNVGNLIFFVASAWFLSEKATNNKKKALHMVLDVWVISVMFLAGFLLHHPESFSLRLVGKSVLPITLDSYWYITCYLVFYLIYPLLNLLMDRVGQRVHLRITLVLVVFYVLINTVFEGRYFYTHLAIFITVYFLVSYLKRYCRAFTENVKANAILFAVGAVAFVGEIAGTYWLAAKFSLGDNWLLFWNVLKNPATILLCISLVNLASTLKFRSKAVNSVAGLSLLIYLFHANFIFTDVYRPLMWGFVMNHFQARPYWAWCLLLAAVLFAASVAVSYIYRFTLQRLTAWLAGGIYKVGRKYYLKIENKLIKEKNQNPAN